MITRTSPWGKVSADSATTAAAPCLTRVGQPVGAADDEGDILRVVAPPREPDGKLAGGPRRAALVERHDRRALACGADAQRLGGEQLGDGFAAIARLGLELDEIEHEVTGQAARVVGPARGNPGGHPVAKRDDTEVHAEAQRVYPTQRRRRAWRWRVASAWAASTAPRGCSRRAPWAASRARRWCPRPPAPNRRIPRPRRR